LSQIGEQTRTLLESRVEARLVQWRKRSSLTRSTIGGRPTVSLHLMFGGIKVQNALLEREQVAKNLQRKEGRKDDASIMKVREKGFSEAMKGKKQRLRLARGISQRAISQSHECQTLTKIPVLRKNRGGIGKKGIYSKRRSLEKSDGKGGMGGRHLRGRSQEGSTNQTGCVGEGIMVLTQAEA